MTNDARCAGHDAPSAHEGNLVKKRAACAWYMAISNIDDCEIYIYRAQAAIFLNSHLRCVFMRRRRVIAAARRRGH
jgi:hypothetical protein